jgi:hypothetical protein
MATAMPPPAPDRPKVSVTLGKIVDRLERALPAEVVGARRKMLRLALEFGAQSVIWELMKESDATKRLTILDALYHDLSVKNLGREIRDFCEANGIPVTADDDDEHKPMCESCGKPIKEGDVHRDSDDIEFCGICFRDLFPDAKRSC